MGGLRSTGIDGAGLVRRAWWRSGRGVRTAWERRGLTEADVMLASYPRSGSLWLRFMLYGVLRGDPTVEKVNAEMPYQGGHAAAARLLPRDGRLVKTHDAYAPAYRQAIHLVRDARDCAISHFTFLQRNGRIRVDHTDDPTLVFQRYLAGYVAGRMAPHGSWLEHLDSWSSATALSRSRILLVRYEDLRTDTQAQLGRILDWLGLAHDEQSLADAIERAGLERMRRLTRALDAEWDQRAGNAPGRFTFVNAGRVSGWSSALSPDQARLFAPFAPGLERLGYPA